MRIYDKRITLTQPIDTWQDFNDDDQQIIIQTHCVDDNAHYLTIETKRWAIDKEDIPKLADLLTSMLIELENQPNGKDNRIPDHLS